MSVDGRARRKHVDSRSQQRRLRHLVRLSAHDLSPSPPTCQKDDTATAAVATHLHFTLHQRPSATAFYTSETILDSTNPKWRSFDASQFSDDVDAASSLVTAKVWRTSGGESRLVVEWTVCLKSLHFLCRQAPKNDWRFEADTLVFGMFESFYTLPDRLQEPSGFVDDDVAIDAQDVRESYDINCLQRIHTVQTAIKQTQAAIRKTRKKIHRRLQLSQEDEPRMAREERRRVMLQLLGDELRVQTRKRKAAGERLTEIRAIVEEQTERLATLHDSLKDEKLKMRTNLSKYDEKRETLLKTNAQLILRRKQLVSELAYIYPVREISSKGLTICGVRLPNSEDFAGHDENEIAVGLGYVSHSIAMVGQFLNVPLRYAVMHSGSRSKIVDHVMDKIPDEEREFPLFSKGREKIHYNYGVYLLNKNIAQLRFYCGMLTQDLRATLFNLQTLLDLQHGAGAKINRLLDGPHSITVATVEQPSPSCSERGEREVNSCPIADGPRTPPPGVRWPKRLPKSCTVGVHSFSLDGGLDELDHHVRRTEGDAGENAPGALRRPPARRKNEAVAHGSEPDLARHASRLSARDDDGGRRFFDPPKDLWATGSSRTASDEDLEVASEGCWAWDDAASPAAVQRS